MEVEPINQLSAKSLFSYKRLGKQAEDYKEELNKTSSTKELSKCILSNFVEFYNYYTAVGDQEFNKLTQNLESDLDEIYVLHYQLSESFKDALLLHRDVLLQIYIADYKKQENTVTKESLDEHFTASKAQLNDVISAFIQKEKSLQNDITSTPNSSNFLGQIKHQTNPWTIYKAQFETLKKHLKDIDGVYNSISKTIKIFSDIEKHNTTFIMEAESACEKAKNGIGEAIHLVKKITTIADIPNVINWIDTVIPQSENEKTYQDSYTQTLELKLKALKEVTVPVATEDGLLLSRTIDFNKATQKWIDFEILPALVDLWKHKASMMSFYKHSLLNLKSSLLIEKGNNNINAMPSQFETLKSIHATISDYTDNLNQITKEVRQKFDVHFEVSQLFSNEDFLEVSFQSSLSQMASEQGNILNKFKAVVTNNLNNFNSQYEKSALFNSKSKIETAIDCINYRMFKESNAHYDTLFLNKNFLGDLFILDRVEQEQAVARAVSQFQNGFSKAILVTGDALSGKTTFTQQIAKKHFPKNAVFLQPNASVTFAGRKFETSKNLKEALSDIKKGLTGVPSLLVIDDLSCWRDEEVSLLQNVRHLLSFIASYSDEILVVITTTSSLKRHIDSRLAFSEAFSTHISLNRASADEIYNAIAIRHGASHKTLVNKDNVSFSEREMKKAVTKLARNFNSNLGQVLQAWTYGTTVVKDNNVVYQEDNYSFPDFFNEAEAIVLKYVLLYHHINEVTLKNFVVNSYERQYDSGLKRLYNTKVLLRDEEGNLFLNPVIGFDVKHILIYRGILN